MKEKLNKSLDNKYSKSSKSYILKNTPVYENKVKNRWFNKNDKKEKDE